MGVGVGGGVGVGVRGEEATWEVEESMKQNYP